MSNMVIEKNKEIVAISDNIIPCGYDISMVIPVFGLPYFIDAGGLKIDREYKHHADDDSYTVDCDGYSACVECKKEGLCEAIITPADYSLKLVTPERVVWSMRNEAGAACGT